MSLDPLLRQLIDDTAAQLDAATGAVATGQLVELNDLVPRLERISALAVEQRALEAAPLLAGLIERLDTLGAALKLQIDAAATARQPDPGQAAALYRAAQPPGTGSKG